jgi:hypothetical protein
MVHQLDEVTVRVADVRVVLTGIVAYPQLWLSSGRLGAAPWPARE